MLEQKLNNDEQLSLLLKKSPGSIHQFLTKCMTELWDNKVTTLLEDSLQVKFQEISCSGFFHHKPAQFAVALDKEFEQWFKIFVHEFSHFKQFLEVPKRFNEISDNLELFFDWVADKKTLSQQEVELFKKDAIEVEFDCENRVLKLIEINKFEKILDPILYAQKANAYVNFYHYVVETKKWYKAKKEPYSLKEVYEVFPKKLVILDNLNNEMKMVYKNCIE